ncbi:hypothetical protein ABFA07_002738 [Porites harrisoni]
MEVGQVAFISFFIISSSFFVSIKGAEEDPAKALEHLFENLQDDEGPHIEGGCNDVYIYWCRRYSLRCSHPIVYNYCPRTCHRCTGANGWSSWTAYSRCSKTCYYGLQTRSRKCTSASSSACPGSSMESRRCNERVSCLKDNVGSNSAHASIQGVWTQWGSYSKCSKSCGSGLQSRVRKCINPSNPSGHERCPGPFRQRRPCNQSPCPVDGGWTSWGRFRQCSKTCGGGKQYKQRFCKNPSPKGGGKVCQGPNKFYRKCNRQPCAVHGNWSPWSVFGICSRTCGGGIKYRSRFCNNPAPSSGGNTCSGPSRQSIACNTRTCSVDGHWSPWGAFGDCSKSCGGGKQRRSRTCTNPAPSGGGNTCLGPLYQSIACNTKTCPVNGHWSAWGSFGPCSRSCGSGKQYRRRACNNPAPSSGGRTCNGPSHQSKACNIHVCAVNGHWLAWGSFGPCTRSCGSGKQYRRRACNNPAPSSGGRTCNGPSHQSKACNIHVCAVDGHWSSWSSFGPCSKTCGGGIQYRSRACDKPAPSPNGKTCPGQSQQSKACNTHACPGCKDFQNYRFCSYVARSYRCGQYYVYCRKTCNACHYRIKAY